MTKSATAIHPRSPLRQLCRFLSGGTPSKGTPAFWQGPIPWVSPKDMKSHVLSDAKDHISQAAVDQSATCIAPVGAVLVLVRGMGLAKGLPVCLLSAPCAFNQDIKALVPSERLHPEYLAWSLRAAAPILLAQRDIVTHGTLKLDTDLLESLEIATPPLTEQRRIAERLHAQMDAVERARRASEEQRRAIEHLSAALLREAFAAEG